MVVVVGNDATSLLVPRLLYGTLGHAGRGWKKVVRKAWASGWKQALANVEWIDMFTSPGAIILGEAPRSGVSCDLVKSLQSGYLVEEPQYRTQPFFAMYHVHSALKDIAYDEHDRDYFRLRDLSLEALDWPWYGMLTLWPEGGFLPPCDDCFTSEKEWKAEEKRVSEEALQKLIRHFPVFGRLEERFTRDGSFGIQFPPSGKVHIFGVLRYCLRLGMTESFMNEILAVSDEAAEEKLLAWVKENAA